MELVSKRLHQRETILKNSISTKGSNTPKGLNPTSL